MDHDAAVAELAPAHRRVLRLRAQGRTDDVIATELGIEPASVPMLLRVAAAKLEALLRTPDPDENG